MDLSINIAHKHYLLMIKPICKMLDFEHLRHILGPATQGHPKTLIENSLVSKIGRAHV